MSERIPDVARTFESDHQIFVREDEIWRRDQYYIRYADVINKTCRKYGLKTILEIACGSGYVPLHLDKDLIWEGMDGYQGCVDKAKENNPNSVVTLGEIRTYEHSEVDLVCSFAFLKHFYPDEWPTILRRILDCGRYGLNMIQRTSLPNDVEDGKVEVNLGPHNWISASTLERAVRDAGHEILECVTFWRNPNGKFWDDFVITRKIR